MQTDSIYFLNPKKLFVFIQSKFNNFLFVWNNFAFLMTLEIAKYAKQNIKNKHIFFHIVTKKF